MKKFQTRFSPQPLRFIPHWDLASWSSLSVSFPWLLLILVKYMQPLSEFPPQGRHEQRPRMQRADKKRLSKTGRLSTTLMYDRIRVSPARFGNENAATSSFAPRFSSSSSPRPSCRELPISYRSCSCARCTACRAFPFWDSCRRLSCRT
jgi:hypothetical protein